MGRLATAVFVAAVVAWCIFLANGLNGYMHDRNRGTEVPATCPAGQFMGWNNSGSEVSCQKNARPAP